MAKVKGIDNTPAPALWSKTNAVLNDMVRRYAEHTAKSLKGKPDHVMIAFCDGGYGPTRFEYSFMVMPKGISVEGKYERKDSESVDEFFTRVCKDMSVG